MGINKHFCGDCGQESGEYHKEFCDIERCPICKNQFISCDCDYKEIGEDFVIDKKGKKYKRFKVLNNSEEDFGI